MVTANEEYTISYTPKDNTDNDSDTVSIAAGVAADSDDNDSAEGSNSINYDTSQPRVSIVDGYDDELKAGETSTINIDWTESVFNFEAEDITLTTGTGTLGTLNGSGRLYPNLSLIHISEPTRPY